MMRTKLACLLLFIAGSLIHVNAQPPELTSWQRKGTFSTNLSQSSLTNWTAGGESAVGWDAFMSYELNFNEGPHLWNNRLELGYGLNKTKTQGTRKINDKIYLSSNYGYKISRTLYASALVTFLTQFDEGFNYDVSDDIYISKFMAPGYLAVGAGLTWLPRSFLTVTFTPATWRGTFVTDSRLSDEGAYGVKEGKHLKSEFGANLRAEIKYEIWTNMHLYSRLNLYSNYLEDPQNVDVNWDVMLNMKVNNWISANLTTNLVYDNDQKIPQKDGSIGPRVQFKEVLGVGVNFNF